MAPCKQSPAPPHTTSASTTPPCTPANRFSLSLPPPTETPPYSPNPTNSNPSAAGPPRSHSGTAPTIASEQPWPASRSTPHYDTSKHADQYLPPPQHGETLQLSAAQTPCRRSSADDRRDTEAVRQVWGDQRVRTKQAHRPPERDTAHRRGTDRRNPTEAALPQRPR